MPEIVTRDPTDIDVEETPRVSDEAPRKNPVRTCAEFMVTDNEVLLPTFVPSWFPGRTDQGTLPSSLLML